MNRVRAGIQSRITAIPRRGRIRAVLILLAAFATAYSLLSKDSGPRPAKPDNGAERTIKTKANKKQKKTRSAALSLTRKEALTHENLALLLQEHPPRLSFSVDTIRTDAVECAVHYSLDMSLQQSVRKLMERYHPKYGAVAAIHPVSGRVICLLEYKNPDEPPLAERLYCRSILPAASIMKVVTAAASIEKSGLTASSILHTTGNNHTLYRFQLAPELKGWNDISLEKAFAYSVNPVFARLGIYTLGAQSFKEYLDKFGFNSPVPFDLPVESARAQVTDSAFSLAELGSGFNRQTRISPMYGAILAAAVVNKGTMPVPTLVDSVIDIRTGIRKYEAEPRIWRTPIRPSTASNMKTLMKAVTQYGTARKSFVYVKRSVQFDEIDYGGKTGNIELDGTGRIDWFIGFASDPSNPDLAIALSVVTVHGPYWTVHSSYAGAEMIREFIRSGQKSRDAVPLSARNELGHDSHPATRLQ